jgi:hypothetical protein
MKLRRGKRTRTPGSAPRAPDPPKELQQPPGSDEEPDETEELRLAAAQVKAACKAPNEDALLRLPAGFKLASAVKQLVQSGIAERVAR